MRAKKLLKQIQSQSRSDKKKDVEAEESDSQIERADRLKLIKNLQIQVRGFEKQLHFIDSQLKQELYVEDVMRL